MNESVDSQRLASPYATGGGGVEFENYVGAFYVATALCAGVPRGRVDGIAREVRFQRLFEGEYLDDIVVVSELDLGDAKLTLQAKRDVTFSEHNVTFGQVLKDCWNTFKAPNFSPGIDCFGIALGLYNKTVAEHYQAVLTSARDSSSAIDFLSRVSTQRLASEHQRNFVRLIRSKLTSFSNGELSDEDLWRFLRSMVILHFDFQEEGSRDYSYIVTLLKYLVPIEERDKVQGLFSTLVNYVARAKRTAGSLTREELVARLGQEGFRFRPQSDHGVDLARLAEHGGFIMKEIRTEVGGIGLHRTELLMEAHEVIQGTSLVELVGPPGAGKSAILKTLVGHMQGKGPVMVLAGERITGTGWNGFASDLQLAASLQDILVALSSGRVACIFIDGIDKVIESGPRLAVNDLLRTVSQLYQTHGFSSQWRFIVTTREENLNELHSWLAWRDLEQPAQLSIPEFTTEEIRAIVRHSPRLRPLLTIGHLEPIIRNPFMLSILEDQRMLPGSAPIPPIATEVEVATTWWEKVVGAGSTGTARREALLELGRRTTRSHWQPLTVQGLDPSIIDSLRSDQIIIRDSNRDVYHFRHDLIEDWVLYRVVDSFREELPTYLKDLSEPHGLYRPLQLLGANLLETWGNADEWIRMVERLETANSLSARWKRAILTAPLTSARASELLTKAEAFLLSNNCQRLVELLIASRTLEVSPDFALLPIMSEGNLPFEEVLSMLLVNPVPIWRTWLPLIGWIIQIANRLPDQVRPEVAKIFELWQTKTPSGIRYRTEVGELAFRWLEDVKDRWGHGSE